MKGKQEEVRVLEEAHAYRVNSGFTDWTTRKKYRSGDRIVIAESERNLYDHLFKAGKLKKIPGKRERKHVQKESY